MKILIASLFLTAYSFSQYCCGQSIPLEVQDSLLARYKGTWKPVKWVHAETGAGEEDIQKKMASSISISYNSLKYFENLYSNPIYSLSKENTYQFTNVLTRIEINDLSLNSDSITVLNTTFGDQSVYGLGLIIDNDTLIAQENGVFYFLIKENLQNNTLITGDTVRCLYHEDKTCTGFVIQGSRVSGKVIHVNPLNKNVPLEVEERKEILKSKL